MFKLNWNLIVGILSFIFLPSLAFANCDSTEKLPKPQAYKDLKAWEEAINSSLRSDNLCDAYVAFILRQKGSYALRNKDYEVAVAHLTSSLQIERNEKLLRIWTLVDRCTAYSELNYYSAAQLDCEDANQDLEIILSDNVHDINTQNIVHLVENATYAYATLFLKIGKYESAIKFTQKRISLLRKYKDSSYVVPWYLNSLLAYLHVYLGKNEIALNLSNEILLTKYSDIFKTTDAAEIINLQGIIFLGQGDFRRAEELFYKSIKTDSSYLDPVYQLCVLSIFEGKWNVAENRCKDAVENSHENPVYLDAYGVSLLAQKKFERALEAFKHALDFDPNSTSINANYATALKYTSSQDEFLNYTAQLSEKIKTRIKRVEDRFKLGRN